MHHRAAGREGGVLPQFQLAMLLPRNGFITRLILRPDAFPPPICSAFGFPDRPLPEGGDALLPPLPGEGWGEGTHSHVPTVGYETDSKQYACTSPPSQEKSGCEGMA